MRNTRRIKVLDSLPIWGMGMGYTVQIPEDGLLYQQGEYVEHRGMNRLIVQASRVMSTVTNGKIQQITLRRRGQS